VMVGYRGMNGSVVLDCPEANKVFRASRGDMLSDSGLDEISTAFIRCAERMQEEGTDIGGYTAAEIIQDIEAARHALGYERINLFS